MTEIDLAALTAQDLLNFRRSLLGLLSVVELALTQHGLTFPKR